MKRLTATIACASAIMLATAAIGQRSGRPTAPKLSDATNSPFVVRTSHTSDSTSFKFHSGQQAPQRVKAYDVPFIEDFSSSATLGDWYIQDVNNDGNSWEYKDTYELVRIYWPPQDDNNDDYLVTPGINLGADDIYTLTFSYGSQGSRFDPSQMSVTMGTSEYATQHTTILYSDDNIVNFWNGSMKTVTITLPVEADGTYYFGFHCTSPSTSYCLYLDDIKVEQNGSHAAPGPVENLMVTPAEKGALKATINLTAPMETADGEPLGALDAIDLYRDDSLIHTFESPTPGYDLDFVDTTPARGLHVYKAIAIADEMEGVKAEASAYVGVDTPRAVTNIKAEETATGVSLSWDAPQGVNGGYVGPDVVKYRIIRSDAFEDDLELDDRYDDTSYLDEDLDMTVQNSVSYSITAFTVAGSSDAAYSKALFTGPSYPVPFYENFEYSSLKTSPWIMEYINSGLYPSRWQITPMGADPVCPPVDGDDGMLEFVSTLSGFALYQGNVIRLATPVIDLSETSEPYLSFYLFHYDTSVTSSTYDEETEETVTTTTTYNDKLSVQVALNNGEYVDVPNSTIMLSENNNGWTEYKIPLSAYKAKKVSIALVGTADAGGNICVDHMMVTDTYPIDLKITGLLGPSLVNVGETATYTANIINYGSTSTKNYTVDLYVDDEKVDSQKGPGAAIFANGGEKSVTLTFTPEQRHSGETHKLYAVINSAVDDCQTNNQSDIAELTVPGNEVPRVEAISGNPEGANVTINWEEPDFEAFLPAVNDNMESYAPFAISNIGNYTLIDNDGASATYVVSGISSYENAGAAMAWQVFDPTEAGIDTSLDFNRRWICHSGNQCLISWGADVSTGVSSNDDWLISPQLTGESQKITFYIKGITLAYPERFRVLYSDDTNSISDFVKIAEANYYSPSSYWRKFSVTLPDGAQYFAIHCISADAFGLMVDDIQYTPDSAYDFTPDLLGYNVYRDNVKINSEPIGELAYTDVNVPAGDHEYYVTATFPEGESAPSPRYVLSTSGLKDLTQAATANIRIAGHSGCIEIDGFNGRANVFAIDGRKVASEKIAGNLTFSINPGVYIVDCAGTISKVIVK